MSTRGDARARVRLARLLDSRALCKTRLLPRGQAERTAPLQNATMTLNPIITETLLLGVQRQLQQTAPHLSVLARVERAQALVDQMLPEERADYFVWLAATRGLASPHA
jgi:hypothetical protein